MSNGKNFLKPVNVLLILSAVVAVNVELVVYGPEPLGSWTNKPHVFTYLYTKIKTRKLMATSVSAVSTLMNVFKPDSFGLSGRVVLLCVADVLRFVLIFRASAGNANDCVNVNLCSEPVSE